MATVRQAERDAAAMLQGSWWTVPTHDLPLPVDPMQLARQLGLTVRHDFLATDQSGSIRMPPQGQVVITLNASDHPNRQRFTCAHELGHYTRRRQEGGASRDVIVDNRATLAAAGTDVEEIYANQFAAALLMPGHLVVRYRQQGLSVGHLAAQFGTSAMAMELRLRNLSLA